MASRGHRLDRLDRKVKQPNAIHEVTPSVVAIAVRMLTRS